MAKTGLKRMFLHAHRVTIQHPLNGEMLILEAPLPAALSDFLVQLDRDQ
jgi:23S rRNA pseudouridine955/2504/2580 synthase